MFQKQEDHDPARSKHMEKTSTCAWFFGSSGYLPTPTGAFGFDLQAATSLPARRGPDPGKARCLEKGRDVAGGSFFLLHQRRRVFFGDGTLCHVSLDCYWVGPLDFNLLVEIKLGFHRETPKKLFTFCHRVPFFLWTPVPTPCHEPSEESSLQVVWLRAFEAPKMGPW